MPTIARVVAGLLYAGLAWYVSEHIKPRYPEGFDFGYFSEVNAAVAFVVGWRVMGSRAGLGYATAIGAGLTTSAAMVLWALFLHSSGEMIRLALRRRYDDAVEAIVGIFELMLDHAVRMSGVEVWILLVAGGAVAGTITEAVGRKTR